MSEILKLLEERTKVEKFDALVNVMKTELKSVVLMMSSHIRTNVSILLPMFKSWI